MNNLKSSTICHLTVVTTLPSAARMELLLKLCLCFTANGDRPAVTHRLESHSLHEQSGRPLISRSTLSSIGRTVRLLAPVTSPHSRKVTRCFLLKETEAHRLRREQLFCVSRRQRMIFILVIILVYFKPPLLLQYSILTEWPCLIKYPLWLSVFN